MFFFDLPIFNLWKKVSPLVLDINFQAGGPQFRNYGTGKLKRAMDLALDKIAGSKYSPNLGGFVYRRSKVTGKWRRKTMGLVPVGVNKAGLLYGYLRYALGGCAQRRFFWWSCMDVEGDFDHKNSGNNLQAGLKVY